jgi:hypothetical protein
VELKSKKNLKNISLANGSSDSVLVEGNIGELVQATFKEGIILEVIGKNGVLRIDLGDDEIVKTTDTNLTGAKIAASTRGAPGNSEVRESLQ